MGRSFIRPEYQRRSEPLMLLWKGIGRFAANQPRYRNLFGPVSISADYHATSTRLLMSFLKASQSVSGLSRLVRPRKPVKDVKPRDWDPSSIGSIRNLDDVDELALTDHHDRGEGLCDLIGGGLSRTWTEGADHGERLIAIQLALAHTKSEVRKHASLPVRLRELLNVLRGVPLSNGLL